MVESSAPWPLIGVTACRVKTEAHAYQRVTEKYVTVVTDEIGGCPVLIPALEDGIQPDVLVARLDGILLTGSPSNVEPRHYQGPASEPDTLHDAHRDETTLPLVPRAVAAGLPLFAVCRGFQEMNVAYGGTLWQKVQDVPGMRDHREDKEQPLDVQYAPAHEVELVRGGLLHGLAGADRVPVNSLHAQGVQTLGRDLEIEARAPDGLVEAFRVRNAPGFALAVQWHPEWQVHKNPFSHAMFAAFGDAARARINARK